MKLDKITVLVLLSCAAFVLGSPQAPPDDDDFDIDGSGFGPQWVSTTAAPQGRAVAAATTTSWREAGELDGSGSGHHSDDEDYDSYSETEDEDVYEDYDEDYLSYDYPDEGDGDTSGGSVGGSRYNVEDSRTPDRKDESGAGESIGKVGDIPPADEKPIQSEHKPSLGAEHRPETKPSPSEPPSPPAGPAGSDGDLVIPPEVTLKDLDDVRGEVTKLKEKELELEKELEERQRQMDGLGTKAVDRDTSFFAQPGILAAVVGGAVVGLLCAILLVMLIVYRMRKKDEGSYPVEETKRSLTGNNYTKNKEFYA